MRIITKFEPGQIVYRIYKAGGKFHSCSQGYPIEDIVITREHNIVYKLIDEEVGYGSNPYLYSNEENLFSTIESAQKELNYLNDMLIKTNPK